MAFPVNDNDADDQAAPQAAKAAPRKISKAALTAAMQRSAGVAGKKAAMFGRR